MMMEETGFEVVDSGVDVSSEKFVEVAKEKEALRHHILFIRRNLLSKKVREKSEKIREFFFDFPFFQRANLILFYLSLPNEVQTERLIKDTFRMGKRVAVPLVKKEKREIVPCELNNYNKELEDGPWGILQPKAGCKQVDIKEIDLVVVPGVAFDEKGHRLGFGAGFYDRFLKLLSSTTKIVSLSFEVQVVKKIPSLSHDVPVEYIITEKRIIKCKRRMCNG
ncbi:5-formyltetrahydrofolate cyclo-ligase [Patescibacteria group bacterium]|nr:5-formyltetrahydrofolate cyclo-ligase [Patescibacteria group bacterium]